MSTKTRQPISLPPSVPPVKVFELQEGISLIIRGCNKEQILDIFQYEEDQFENVIAMSYTTARKLLSILQEHFGKEK